MPCFVWDSLLGLHSDLCTHMHFTYSSGSFSHCCLFRQTSGYSVEHTLCCQLQTGRNNRSVYAWPIVKLRPACWVAAGSMMCMCIAGGRQKVTYCHWAGGESWSQGREAKMLHWGDHQHLSTPKPAPLLSDTIQNVSVPCLHFAQAPFSCCVSLEN